MLRKSRFKSTGEMSITILAIKIDAHESTTRVVTIFWGLWLVLSAVMISEACPVQTVMCPS